MHTPDNNGLERTRRVGGPASRAVVGVSPRRSSQCCTGYRVIERPLRSAVVAGLLMWFPACAPAGQTDSQMPKVAVPQTSLCAPARAILPIPAGYCCRTREQCRGVEISAHVGPDGRVSKVAVTGSADERLVGCVLDSMKSTTIVPATMCVTDERVASDWSYELTSMWDEFHYDEFVALASASKRSRK